MPSFGHRALLRLRRSPLRRPPIPQPAIRIHHRGFSVHPPRQTASAARQPSPEEKREEDDDPRARASPLATSSRITLDAFLDPDAVLSQPFAKDEELIAACLSQEPKSWLDPVTAYRQLRQSPLFSQHLVSFGSRIRTLYAHLRSAGCHEELLADLLLRAPEPRLLREILDEEADSAHSQTDRERLRLGLVAQAYRAIAPEIKSRALPRLSRPALVGVSRALRAENDNELLPSVFYELAATARWDARDWPLLEICLHLARDDPRAALKLLTYPLSMRKLPGRVDEAVAAHPRAAHIVVQSTVARSALLWGMHERATRAIDDLLATMAASTVDPAAVELVLHAIRTADVTPHRHNSRLGAWAHARLLSMAHDSRFPPLPASAVNLHLDALTPEDALKFYLALPNPMQKERRYEAPSSRHLVRLAHTDPPPAALRRMAYDAVGQHLPPDFLRTLADAGLLALAEETYHRTSALDRSTALALVRAFASSRGEKMQQRHRFARRVVSDYLGIPRKEEPEETALFRVTCDALLGEQTRGEVQSIADLLELDGKAGAKQRLTELAETEPALARRLKVMASPWFILPDSGAAYAAACAKGRWDVLKEVALPPFIDRGNQKVVLTRKPPPVARSPSSSDAAPPADADADTSTPQSSDPAAVPPASDAAASDADADADPFSAPAEPDSDKYVPTDIEAPFVVALVRARVSRLSNAVTWFEFAAKTSPDAAMKIPTASALLQRCAEKARWDLGSRVLKHIWENDALSVILRWFADMGRLGGRRDKVLEVWEREKVKARKRIWRLQGKEVIWAEIDNMVRNWERRGVVRPEEMLEKERGKEPKAQKLKTEEKVKV